MFDKPERISEALARMPAADESARDRARSRQRQLTKPPGSLGRLEEIAIHLAGWQHDLSAERIKVVVFAGNHGVTSRGVSPYPASVTAQMVENFRAGGAAINALTETLGLSLEVIPLSLETPTADFAAGPALTEAEALAALSAGATAAGGCDLLVLGEMGIGNTTAAAALAAVSLGGTGADWAGPGTGLAPAGVVRKAAVIDDALALHRPHAGTAFERLRRLGGRETAAIAGAVIAARHARLPVLLDGYVVCASLAPLFAEAPGIVSHCLAGHLSAEPAHGRLLHAFGLAPLFDLGMRLGEGSGAAVAAAVVRCAVATHTRMATFEEAHVESRTDD